MINDSDAKKLAEELHRAEETRQQVPLISKRFPDAKLADAYKVQDAWVAHKYGLGRERIGWKIGLTSKAMQAALNITTPDSGVLFDDMAFEDGATIPKDRFIQPRIEAEIAFILKAPLKGEKTSMFDVLNATDFVTPSLEILDTRVVRKDAQTGQVRTIVDTVADNAANAGLVLGGRAMRVDDIDLRWIGAIVQRNGVVEETGLGAGVLNHPALGIVWLVKRLAQFDIGLLPGEIVLSGSFIRPVETNHGDTIIADFGPLGTVSSYFE